VAAASFIGVDAILVRILVRKWGVQWAMRLTPIEEELRVVA
jgi:hypothetical protein